MVSFPITNEAERNVDAIVANVNGASFAVPHYSSAEEKAVAHLWFMIKDHPFVDGNKRTAILTFGVLCLQNGLEESFQGYDLDALAVFIESLKDQDHQKAINYIANNIFS